MKQLNYFPLHTNHYNSVKVLELRQNFGLEGYAIYIMLLQKLAEVQNRQLLYDKIPTLAFDFHCDKDLLSKIVDMTCDKADDYFFDKSLNESLGWYDAKYNKQSDGGKKAAAKLTPEQRKEKAEKAALKRWEKKQVDDLKAEIEHEVQSETQNIENAKLCQVVSINNAKSEHKMLRSEHPYANNKNRNKNENGIGKELESESELESEPYRKELEAEPKTEIKSDISNQDRNTINGIETENLINNYRPNYLPNNLNWIAYHYTEYIKNYDSTVAIHQIEKILIYIIYSDLYNTQYWKNNNDNPKINLPDIINHINKNNPVIGSSSIDDVIKSARKHPENLNDTLSQLKPQEENV